MFVSMQTIKILHEVVYAIYLYTCELRMMCLMIRHVQKKWFGCDCTRIYKVYCFLGVQFCEIREICWLLHNFQQVFLVEMSRRCGSSFLSCFFTVRISTNFHIIGYKWTRDIVIVALPDTRFIFRKASLTLTHIMRIRNAKITEMKYN